jgi:ABC-type transporter Mla subunit MlaD
LWRVAQDELEKQIAEIEETQDALRESIEQSKELAAKTDKLLKRHRKALRDRAPG